MRHLLASGFVVVLLGCGGSLSDGTPSPDGGGGGGGDGGADGGGCTTAQVDGRRACVPGIARAGTALTVEVDAPDGCLGCFTTLACEVTVSGERIDLTMRSKTCPPPGDIACPAVCEIPKTTCTVPPLAAGRYTVRLAGEGDRPGLPARTLVVEDAAGETSCTLGNPDAKPPTLEAATYGSTCSTGEDCFAATVGDVCQPCKCPTAAIAETSAAAYESDYREASSQCDGDRSGIACAACPPTKTTCEIPQGAPGGTCKLVPANP